MKAFETPVLFLVFNRPDTTAQVFAQIRAIQPKYLYIAADGPRSVKEGEEELCAETRRIATAIDWDCELKTLFREQNLGCGKAVSEAITWFFEQVEEGVILEDDCLPDMSFFTFAEELLIKYKYDREVMSISGTNLLGSWKLPKQSYFFGHGGIWGWATWRRAWQLYDKNMDKWELPSTQEVIKKGLVTNEWYDFYKPMMESAFNDSIDTWDAQWVYSILFNRGKSINPCVNLVKNIGFDYRATHTITPNDIVESLPLLQVTFPLMHPEIKEEDVDFLNISYEVFTRDSLPRKTKDTIALKGFSKIQSYLSKIWRSFR
ncbi:MAG: hypothetical protein K2X48_06025 [Chitinophagaceae bacterium]|nr:hypothetical protein [Chitinophagaceae bacterium]